MPASPRVLLSPSSLSRPLAVPTTCGAASADPVEDHLVEVARMAFGDPVVLGVHPKLPWWTGEGGASQLIKYQQRIEMHMAGPARHLGHPRGNAGVPREKPRVPGRHCAQRANGRRRRRFVTRNLSQRGADMFFFVRQHCNGQIGPSRLLSSVGRACAS